MATSTFQSADQAFPGSYIDPQTGEAVIVGAGANYPAQVQVYIEDATTHAQSPVLTLTQPFPKPVALDPPATSSASARSSSNISYNCSPVAHAIGYALEVALTAGGNYIEVYRGVNSTYLQTGLPASSPRYSRWKAIGVNGYKDSGYSSVATATTLAVGARVTGRIPVDAELDIYSLQNPPQPIVAGLFANEDPFNFAPDFYGAMFDPASEVWVPAPGMNPVVTRFELGAHQGDYDTRWFRIFGRRNGVETLLVDYAANANLPQFVNPTGYTYQVENGDYDSYRFESKGNAKPSFIHPVGDYTPVAPYVEDVFVKYALENMMGTNLHPLTLLQEPNDANVRDHIPAVKKTLLSYMSDTRMYISMGNINPNPGDFIFDQDSQGARMDNMATELAAQQPKWCATFENVPEFIYQTYPPDPNGNHELVPIRYPQNQTDPRAYDEIADFYFQVAARWGFNKNVDPALVKSRTGYFYPNDPSAGSWTKRIGMGVLKYLEPLNEQDKYWKGLFSFWTPAGAAVGMMVIYQKIKAADPSMIVIYPGLASFAPDFMAALTQECIRLYGYDGNGNPVLPWDEEQIHFYPTTGGSQYSNEPTVGVTVENSYGAAYIRRYRAWLNRFKRNRIFGCGEAGYDASTNSPIRGVVPAGSTLTQREWIGIEYLRFALWAGKNGLAYVRFYEWEDREILDQYTQFSIMGMVQTTGTAPNVVLTPWPNLHLLGQLKVLAGKCIHVQEVSSSPLVDMWREPGGRTVYSLHMPTETNLTGSYNLSLPNGGTLYMFDLHSFTPSTQGLASGTVTINFGEQPVFVVAN